MIGSRRQFLYASAAACRAVAQPPLCPDVSPYVHRIAVYGPSEGPTEGFGAGTFIGRDGAFLTAHHVFEQSERAVRAVVDAGGTDCPVEAVLASSRQLDIVIVHVRLGAASVDTPSFGRKVAVGDKVFGFHVGPPLPESWKGFRNIVCRAGQVTAVSPDALTLRGEYFFSAGSSGSPVFNAAGEVIGIALEMVNSKPASGKPDWTYTALPIARALSVPRLKTPRPVADFLAELGRRNRLPSRWPAR